MKILPHGSIVHGSKGSPTAFMEVLEQVNENLFSGYLEIRMKIPGVELWGVVVFNEGKLVESYASKMGVDIFGETAYLYLMDLAGEESTVLKLHALESDNLIDFLMLGRGKVIKIEDGSWRPGAEALGSFDDTVPSRGEAFLPSAVGGNAMIKKVVLLGEPSVGKTSVMRRFVENSFDEAYLSTIGSNVNKKTVTLYDDNGGYKSVRMMIWDIAGDKACDSLKRAYFRGAHAGIIVCDITSERTFHAIPRWIESIIEVVGKVPIIIIGNKCDLEEFRTVEYDDLIEMADRYGFKVFQTSARTGENVEMVFHLIASTFAAQAAGT